MTALPSENMASALPRLAEASWFPVDLHVPDRTVSFSEVTVEALDRSTFMDTRLEVAAEQTVRIAVDALAQLPQPAAPPGWLLHTSFCGSTLLARALHVAPFQVSLKEPLLLRRLGDARHSGWPVEDLCDLAVRLLARPWFTGSGVLLKPTHAALNIAGVLLDAAPNSRAVLLTSSLDDFLISNIKKTPETQAKVPALAERALQAGSLRHRLPAAALQPPDLLCAVALQWAAQRDVLAGLVARYGPQRVQVLDFADMTDDLVAVAVACSRWLGLPAPEQAVRASALAASARNAKATSVAYSAEQRAQEAHLVQQHFGKELMRARDWAERNVLPALTVPLPMLPVEAWP